jgi:CRP/FNR family transcriptional regulator, cyclic AMP receptor protein
MTMEGGDNAAPPGSKQSVEGGSFMELFTCYLCRGISGSQMQGLSGITREIDTRQNEWLFREGEQAEKVFVLKQGAVELLTTVDDRFELPISILRSPGDCFGSSAIIAPHIYSISARSATASQLFAIDQQGLLKLFQEDHELGYIVMTNLAEHLLDRLRETRQELKIHFRTLFETTH